MSDVAEEALLTLPKVLGLISLPLLTGSGSHFAKNCQPPPLDEDCSYLANLTGSVLEDELSTLA